MSSTTQDGETTAECPYSCVFFILGVLWFYVVVECFLLGFFRLVVHSCVILGSWMVLLCALAYYKAQKVATTPHPTRRASVTRTKTIPQDPHPAIQQRVIASIRWLEVDDGEDQCCTLEEAGVAGDNETAASTTETITNIATTTCYEDDADRGEDHEDEPDDNGPKIVVDPEDCVRVDGVLTVSLIDGDPARPFYLPYQARMVKQMRWKMIKTLLAVLAGFLVLRFAMPGLPMIFASSQQVEAYFRACWLCTWSLDYDEGGDADDEGSKDQEEQMKADLEDCCSIPWTVAWAYNLFLIVLVTFFTALSVYVAWKARRAADNQYQMLSPNDEGTDRVIASPQIREGEEAPP